MNTFVNYQIIYLVDPDRVNWFVYGFELKTDLLEDPKFVEIFKK
jgi:hypothetical protein